MLYNLAKKKSFCLESSQIMFAKSKFCSILMGFFMGEMDLLSSKTLGNLKFWCLIVALGVSKKYSQILSESCKKIPKILTQVIEHLDYNGKKQPPSLPRMHKTMWYPTPMHKPISMTTNWWKHNHR